MKKTSHPHKTRKPRTRTAPKTPRKARSKPAPAHRRLKLGLAGVFVALLLVGGALFWREHAKVAKESQARQQSTKEGPLVQTAKVTRAPSEQTLTLEGEGRPFQEATMYAKVSGYLKEIRVIEGTVVKKGDILAVVSSPETDQQYRAAVADAHNRDRIANRYRKLLKQDLISQQEADQVFANAQVADATLLSQQQAKEYETLRAPFDGVVTARYVDPGDLIQNASNSKSTQLAILTLSDTNRLKVDAYVDQKYAPFVHAGLAVETYLPERADEKFKGEVARVSGALDHKTRMLFTEIDFDNSAGHIVSGSFVQVRMKVPTPEFFVLPVEAMVTLNGVPAVAKINGAPGGQTLQFVAIHVVDNDGSNLTVSSGVQEGEQVALNIGAELKDGDHVRAPSDQKVASEGKK